MQLIFPGTRVLVFDPTIFKDDKSTPLSMTIKPATVTMRYGYISKALGYKYPDCVDVQFDHWKKGHISHGHFTKGVEIIKEEPCLK